MGTISDFFTSAPPYAGSSHEEIASYYDQAYLVDDQSPLTAVPMLVGFPSEGRVLDLGSGPGYEAIPLARAGYDVTAVDLSAVAVDRMNAAVPYLKGTLRPVRRELRDFMRGQAAQCFDLVILSQVLQYVSRKEVGACLQEMMRLTASGGHHLLRIHLDDGELPEHRYYPRCPDEVLQYYPANWREVLGVQGRHPLQDGLLYVGFLQLT